ncbi:MAG: ABC transporter permease subunit, partial [Myxococcaceae bacterium]|nr:ABC transporter permease subunit [Myxococcaceae bacterium]
GVEPSVLQAAVGVGLSPRQLLLEVQLPLAMPVILAGIRTSAVWTVGTATLSTPVGQTSLGNYIFSGLQTRNWAAVLVGCAVTAGLALVLDAALGQLETAAADRRRRPLVVGLVLLAGLLAAAVALRPSPSGASPVVRIGTKGFTEQYILGQALSMSLREQGFEAVAVEGLGSSVLFDALAQGDVDVAVDYSGTLWATQLGRTDVASPEAVNADVCAWLETERGVWCVGPLGFENTYALAMPADRAKELGLTSIDQLAGLLTQMRVGTDYELFSRPEWKHVAATYGLEPKEVVSSDPSLMYAALKAGEVDVITTYSTDGRLNAFNLAVLADPKHGFPPYDAMLLVSRAAHRDERLMHALRGWVRAVGVDTMRRANQLVDVDGQSKMAAARWLVSARDAGVR